MYTEKLKQNHLRAKLFLKINDLSFWLVKNIHIIQVRFKYSEIYLWCLRAEITDRYILWGIWVNIWKWFSYKCLCKLLKNMFNILQVIISSLFIRGCSKPSNISFFSLKIGEIFPSETLPRQSHGNGIGKYYFQPFSERFLWKN